MMMDIKAQWAKLNQLTALGKDAPEFNEQLVPFIKSLGIAKDTHVGQPKEFFDCPERKFEWAVGIHVGCESYSAEMLDRCNRGSVSAFNATYGIDHTKPFKDATKNKLRAGATWSLSFSSLPHLSPGMLTVDVDVKEKIDAILREWAAK
jgi:hypothetical protein